MAKPHRIEFLDGLRGIAILLVLAYHAYARWSDLYSFGQRFSHGTMVGFGWLGVHLFFLISGFVILMTLEKCRSFQEFILRRWLRLFPAMLMCSGIVFLTASLFPERPGGIPMWRDVLPGLTFLEPAGWEWLTGTHQGLLEFAFWSLFVEMKFYVVFGLLYFLVGWKKAVGGLIALFALSAVTASFPMIVPGASLSFLLWPGRLAEILSAQYFGWFAAGALYYRYFLTQKRLDMACAMGVAAASAAAIGGSVGSHIAALGVGLLFTVSVLHPGMKTILGHPLLLFIGFISYPLYLLHENMMVAMIVKLGRAMSQLPATLIPILPICGVIGLAWVVARWLEPWTRAVIRRLCSI